jgi:Ca2+-binding RTX toxin-like protein
VLPGHDGHDELYGMNGDDCVNGGDSDDTMCGGLDKSRPDGGTGDDKFVFAAAEGNGAIYGFIILIAYRMIDRR